MFISSPSSTDFPLPPASTLLDTALGCLCLPMRSAEGVGGGGRGTGVIDLLFSPLSCMACFLPSPGILQCPWAFPISTSHNSEASYLLYRFFFFNLLRAGKACGVCECMGRGVGVGVASAWQVWWPLRTKTLRQGIILSVPCEPSFIQRELSEQDQTWLFCALSLSLGISRSFCSPVNTTIVSCKPTREYLIACHLQHCPKWPGEDGVQMPAWNWSE